MHVETTSATVVDEPPATETRVPVGVVELDFDQQKQQPQASRDHRHHWFLCPPLHFARNPPVAHQRPENPPMSD
nr:hypothetical protein Iba_chr03cCG10520 [Ipomoea batatas]